MAPSVVVPAHNEATVIGRCLAFAPRLGEDWTVVVASNGSTDATADLARRALADRPGDHILDIGEPGKANALNVADRAAGAAFPRIYLDADVVVDAATLQLLADILTAGDLPAVAAPRPSFVLTGRPWSVRAFYRVFQALPYANDALVGLGVYAVNAAGHERLGSFPELTADDLYVQRSFSPEERRIVDATFEVQTPLTLRALLKVRTRVAAGNAQLAQQEADRPQFAASGSGTGKALLGLLRSQPRLALGVALYVAVSVLARLRARRSDGTWERDLTTRTPTGEPGNDHAERIRVGHLGFDAVRESEVVAHVLDALAAGRGGLIVTPNVDILQLCRDPAVAALFEAADIVVADGAPVVLASRLQGEPLPERVAGASLVWSLSRAAAAAGRSVFLLGGAPGVAELAARRLESELPGLGPVGTYFPPFGFEDDPAELAALDEALSTASPDLVFVALGAPKQERTATHLAARLPRTWFLGCGGSLTMMAGQVPRAPRWMQLAGIEWVHRLAQEPRRLAKRYLVDDAPYAAAMVARSARAGLRRRGRS